MRLPRTATLAAAALLVLVAPATARTGPPERRVYALEGGSARVPVPAGPADRLWRVEDEAGRPVRDWAPADPDRAVRVPKGGWFRLFERRDGAADEPPQAVGGRFAAGLVIVITGQSQANSFFWDADPAVGAFPAEPGDPAPPSVAAWLLGCDPQAPGCGPDGAAWDPPGNALGGQVLLAELARRLGPVPLALANASWGGASAEELADPEAPAGRHLRRVALAVGPASAALVLAHGTTDAFRGTPPERYAAALARVVEALRAAAPRDARAPPLVLLAPLPTLRGPTRLLGSGKLAALLLPPEGAPAWTFRLGIASAARPLPAPAAARADAIRAAQARAADELGLLPGGDMAVATPGLDGVHWSPGAVRNAAREAAAALARALQPP